MLPDEGPDVFRIAIRAIGKHNIADPGAVWKRVDEIFSKFCVPPNNFSRSSTFWLESDVVKNDLRPHELVVYLVKDMSRSLVRRTYPAEFQRDPPTLNTIGLTAVNQPSGSLSEVYYDNSFHRDDSERIGETIVHELMHNKLNMDRRMHDLAPFSGVSGGFLQERAANLSSLEQRRGVKLEPSGTDIRTMAAAMSRAGVQWFGRVT